MDMLEEIFSWWLADHSLAVQALAAIAGVLLTAALVLTTIAYAIITGKIASESQRSRVAAERQAAAAQRSVDLLEHQLQELLGLGPRTVRDAILDTKRLMAYWTEQAARIASPPYGNPDPEPLASSSLLRVLDHARKISDECVDLILQAHANLRSAKSELEKAYQTAKHQNVLGPLGGGATRYLHVADDFLDKALAIVSQHISKSPPQPQAPRPRTVEN